MSTPHQTNYRAPVKNAGGMRLLVRADAGPSVGTGHVMRSLALGQAWKRLGGSVAFAIGELPSGLIARVASEDFDVYRLQNDCCDSKDANQTAAIAESLSAKWIALDGYRFDDAYQATLAQSECRLLVLDDYQHANHENADLIVNQNAYADAQRYRETSQARILAGPSFALLRSEFNANEFDHADPGISNSSKHIVKQARRILVTFGGEDADNWTLKTLEVLSNLNRKQLIVDCVVGACYQHGPELELFKKTANLSLRIHRNVDHMSALMHRVDVAISAGGSTCYELARCGVPTIVASIADNQIPVALALSQQGVMVSLDEFTGTGRHNISDPMKRLSKTIRRLLNDYETRKTMSELGIKLVDGQGGRRIVSQMASMLCSFRSARNDDAELLWRWRNDPEVRSVSFNQDVIPLESHRNWLARRLDDTETTIWIAEDQSGQPVGQVRFELTADNQTGVISVILDQAIRGRGLGKHLISQACWAFFNSSSAQQIMAQIKPGNIASERAFRHAGFVSIEPVIVDGKIANQYVLVRSDAALEMREEEKVIAGEQFKRSA